MFVIRDQQLRLLVLAQLIRELQAKEGEPLPTPEGFTPEQVAEFEKDPLVGTIMGEFNAVIVKLSDE